mmetsp:Transcript_34319/g.83270  ORF Transcript_34319/g.83270 Transcript_34319/m.83270 type:complete len:81 (+) Transcript_34319:539-781(+)
MNAKEMSMAQLFTVRLELLGTSFCFEKINLVADQGIGGDSLVELVGHYAKHSHLRSTETHITNSSDGGGWKSLHYFICRL